MKRYNITRRGYKYDKLIFWGILGLWVGGLFVLAYKQNFDFHNKLYYRCDSPEGCENPYANIKCSRTWLYGEKCYTSCSWDWCDKATVPMGEYGERPPGFAKYIYLIALLLLFAGLYANHKIHNKGKDFDLELRITENRRVNVIDKIENAKLED